MKRRMKAFLMIAIIAIIGSFPGSSCQAFAMEASEVPVYAVLLQNEEDAVAMTAFYMLDGEGSTYLVTSAYAGALMKEGYEAVLFSKNSKMDIEYVTTENNISFLKSKGIEESTPFQLAESSSASEGVMYFLSSSGEQLEISQKRMDFSGWEKSGDYYQGSEKLANIIYLGAPVLERENGKVIGTVFMNQETQTVLIDMRNMSFPKEAAISVAKAESKAPENEEKPKAEEPKEEGSKEPEAAKEEPEASESSGSSFGIPGWAAAVIIIVALLAFFANSNQKKKTHQEMKAEQNIPDTSGYYEGTVNLNAEKTGKIAPEDQGIQEMLSEWQVRGISGSFAGQTFLVSGSLKFGRKPQNHVAFPQNTKGVSGEHCELTIENDKVILRDLDSTYGTYMNHGIKLEPRISYYLKEGDTFYLADSSQTFRLERRGEDRQEYAPAVKAVSYPLPGKIYRADAKGRLLFGRAGHCQVIFGDDSSGISANHCILYKDSTGMYLMDQGSTNGTFFSENQRLRPNVPYPVKKGMSFFLTSPQYTFVITED